MKYKLNQEVNEFVSKCQVMDCQCKTCSFNAVSNECYGCQECVEHKHISPVKNCPILDKFSKDRSLHNREEKRLKSNQQK